MNRNIKIVLVIIVLVAAAGLGYYFRHKIKTLITTPVSPASSTVMPVSETVTPIESTNSATTESTGSSKTEQSVTINLTKDGFEPNEVTIKAGTKVNFVNNSGQLAAVDSDPHPVHTSYTPLNLGNITLNNSKSLVFDTPGTYHYHNHLNPSQTGTIIVQ